MFINLFLKFRAILCQMAKPKTTETLVRQTSIQTPGHLKQVICRIMRTLRRERAQKHAVFKKTRRMRKAFQKRWQIYIEFQHDYHFEA